MQKLQKTAIFGHIKKLIYPRNQMGTRSSSVNRPDILLTLTDLPVIIDLLVIMEISFVVPPCANDTTAI